MDIFSYMLGAKRGGGSDGGAVSWNDLTDKPFYEEVTEVGGDTLTWDGNTEGRVCAGISYKISDAIPTLTDLENGVYLYLYPDGWYDYHTFVERFEGVITDEYFQFVIVTEKAAGVDLGSITFPESGTYFIADSGAGVYVAALTIPGYTGFKTTTTTVKTLDPKYLPEALQFGEEMVDITVIDNQTFEFEVNGEDGAYFEDYIAVPVSSTENWKSADVTFDGVLYPNIPWQHHMDGGVSLGHKGTSYPMYIEIAIEPEGTYFYCTTDTFDKTHTISIVVQETTAKPLDEKYMPTLTSPSGIKFRLTVDDSGAVSAVEVTE